MIYTDEELNISQKEILSRLADAKVVSSKKYLNDTDWYYIRKAETNEDVPKDVVVKRNEAREFLRLNGY